MAAIDANAGNELVREAQAEGIKVITYDREVSAATPDYHISRNNYDAGKLQAEAALAFVPSGNYAIIRGDPSTIAQADMSQAYDELLKGKPGINIVYDTLTPGWDAALVQRNAEAALQKYPEINAFAVMWDDAAQAVVQALKSAGKKPGEVFVSGLDLQRQASPTSLRAGSRRQFGRRSTRWPGKPRTSRTPSGPDPVFPSQRYRKRYPHQVHRIGQHNQGESLQIHYADRPGRMGV